MQKTVNQHQGGNVLGVEAFEKHIPGVGVQREGNIYRHEQQTKCCRKRQAQQDGGGFAWPGGDQAERDGQWLQHGTHRGRHFQPAFRMGFGDMATDDDHPDKIDPQSDHGVLTGMVETEVKDGETVVYPDEDSLGERQHSLDQPVATQPSQTNCQRKGDD